jgi:hypothetical protein
MNGVEALPLRLEQTGQLSTDLSMNLCDPGNLHCKI